MIAVLLSLGLSLDRQSWGEELILWIVMHQLIIKAVGKFLFLYLSMSIIWAARRSSWTSRLRAACQSSWTSRLWVARRSSWTSRLRAARRSSWTSRLRAAHRSSWASRLRAARRSSWASRRRAARPRLYKYARCVYLGASCSSHFVARLSNLRIIKLISLHSTCCSLLIILWRTSPLGLWP